MKYLFLTITFLLSLSVSSQTIKGVFLIENISSENGHYKIIMNRNDTLYKVINRNYVIEYSKCKDKITVGQKYEILVEQIYPTKEMKNWVVSLKVSVWNGIAIEDKYNNSVYTARNLIGLCILKKEE